MITHVLGCMQMQVSGDTHNIPIGLQELTTEFAKLILPLSKANLPVSLHVVAQFWRSPVGPEKKTHKKSFKILIQK